MFNRNAITPFVRDKVERQYRESLCQYHCLQLYEAPSGYNPMQYVERDCFIKSKRSARLKFSHTTAHTEIELFVIWFIVIS